MVSHMRARKKPEKTSTLSTSTQEILSTTITELDNFGNSLPENNYWGFSLYTLILPQLFEEIGYILYLNRQP